MTHLFGIDLGGTKIEGVVLEIGDRIRPVFRKRIPTERDLGYTHIVQNIQKMATMMVNSVGVLPTIVGIGTPGDTDPQTGLLRNSNTICLNDQPLHADLEKRLGIKVRMANDANCFALAEHHLGVVQAHAPGTNVTYGVIMGTGVGAGIVINGSIWPGRHGIAGEWGHNHLDDSGGHCYCGRAGCVETILSGPSLERFYQSLTGGKQLPLREIIALGREQEAGPERETVDRMITFFGKAVGVVINLLDPDVIVLGGGLGNIDLLYTLGKEEVRKHIFNNRLETPILKPMLGDSAGVFGAALLGANASTRKILRERAKDLTEH